jgi:hypothetical protein
MTGSNENGGVERILTLQQIVQLCMAQHPLDNAADNKVDIGAESLLGAQLMERARERARAERLALRGALCKCGAQDEAKGFPAVLKQVEKIIGGEFVHGASQSSKTDSLRARTWGEWVLPIACFATWAACVAVSCIRG